MRFNEELTYPPSTRSDVRSIISLNTKSLRKTDIEKLSRHSMAHDKSQVSASQKSLSLIKSVSRLKHKQKNLLADKQTTKTG